MNDRASQKNSDITAGRFLTLVFVLFFAWMVFTQFFASRDALRAIDAYYIDKIFHFLGGVWVVGALLRAAPQRKKLTLAIPLFAVSVAWEIFEILAFPEVKYLFHHLYPYWLRDTAGDLAADMLGGLSALWWMSRR